MSLFSKKDQKKVNEKFDFFKQGDFNEDDTKTVLDHEDDILKKCTSGSLAKFLEDIKTMCAMVKAWVKKDYQGIPIKTIGMVTLTLLYVFSPLDLISDYIPGVGLLDDASIVGLCIAVIKSDLEAFKAWAKAHLK
jgi:uncharacterized membrane protein YkvA (DUF1232 family)